MSRDITVGLLWHSRRSGNLGVGALTLGNIALVRRACDALGLTPRFVVLGPREPGPAYVTGADIEAHDIDTRFVLSPSGWAKTLGTLDAVLDIGAGDSFADIYGPKRFAFLWLTKALAIARRVPLLLSPQTIGPFDKPVERRLAAAVLKRVNGIVARDPLSADLAHELAPATPLTLAIDVAFALPFERRTRGDGKVHVALNVSGLLYNKAASGGPGFGLDVDYRALTHGFLEATRDRDDLKIHLVTHVVSVGEDDDAAVADRLAARYPHVERVPDFASPVAAKSFISGMDLVIAGRMHACIAAHSSGVPVVPVAYSRKFVGLFDGVLDYRHGVPVRGMSTAAATAYLLAAIDRREEMRADIVAAEPRVRERLDAYVAILQGFLGHAAA